MPKDCRATRGVAQKVCYERSMLDWCAQQIALPKSDDANQSHLMLEGFLLHARVLRDFLVKSKSSRCDDVLAEHFLEEPVVCTWSCPHLREHKERLDKLLAHLTYTRLDAEKEWNVTKIHAEIECAWRKFLDALPEKTRQWFVPSTPFSNVSGVVLVCTTSSGAPLIVPGKLD